MEQGKPSPAEIVIMAGGGVAFLASFLPFLSAGSQSKNAWGSGLFPLALFPALLGLIVALGAAAPHVMKGAKLPERILTYTRVQLDLALGFAAVLIMIGWLLLDKFGASLGAGFWLMFIGCIALLVGPIMQMNAKQAPTA